MTESQRHWTAATELCSPARACLIGILLWGISPASAQTVDEPPAALEPAPLIAPGKYLWTPELATSGPLLIIVSLPQQTLHVYRNGIRIGISSVSTGKKGHETPTGIYNILQKRREHYSNLYDDAPMPYMQRLTWDGVALHEGHVTGMPASHGCIRLPQKFAADLFALTTTGMLVIIADGATPHPALANPGLFAPVSAQSGEPRPPPTVPRARYDWNPQLAPEGPLSVIISSADSRLVVIRGDTEIGRADIQLPAGARFGMHAWLMLAEPGEGNSPLLPDRQAHRWLSIPLPEHDPPGHAEFDLDIVRGMNLPIEMAAAIHDLLLPGSTVILTDEAIEPGTGLVGVLAEDEADRPKPSPESVQSDNLP